MLNTGEMFALIRPSNFRDDASKVKKSCKLAVESPVMKVDTKRVDVRTLVLIGAGVVVW